MPLFSHTHPKLSPGPGLRRNQHLTRPDAFPEFLSAKSRRRGHDPSKGRTNGSRGQRAAPELHVWATQPGRLLLGSRISPHCPSTSSRAAHPVSSHLLQSLKDRHQWDPEGHGRSKSAATTPEPPAALLPTISLVSCLGREVTAAMSLGIMEEEDLAEYFRLQYGERLLQMLQ
ncbi:LOW QUALITY PROTEIN: Coiled-coil domain-containing protein 42 [Plecturocebus cupreus]